MTLLHIGEVKAKAIVEYRRKTVTFHQLKNLTK